MGDFEGFSQAARLEIQEAVGDYDMPISEYWSGVMLRARKALGITQTQLADAIGCKQPVISELENGEVGGSRFVPAVCRALGIPLPIFFAKDEFDERWVEVGRFLRAKSMKRFLNYLENFEEEAGIAPPDEDQPSPLASDDGEGRRSGTGGGPL